MSHGQAGMIGLVIGLLVGWCVAWLKSRQIVEHLRGQVAHELERLRKSGTDDGAMKAGAMVAVIAANEAPEAARERIVRMADAYERDDRAEMFQLYLEGLEDQIELLATEAPRDAVPLWIGMAYEVLKEERAKR